MVRNQGNRGGGGSGRNDPNAHLPWEPAFAFGFSTLGPALSVFSRIDSKVIQADSNTWKWFKRWFKNKTLIHSIHKWFNSDSFSVIQTKWFTK